MSPIDFSQFTVSSDHLVTARADAQLIGCNADRVNHYKRQHRLSLEEPLTVHHQQRLKDELDADARRAKGAAIALQQRLQRLNERATHQRLVKIANAVTALPPLGGVTVPRIFLLEGLEIVGIKRRQKLVKGVWSDLERLIPDGALFDYDTSPLPENNLISRCMFWGAAIRLATLDGEPPADAAEFLDWCGYSVHQTERQREAYRFWSDVLRTMNVQPTTTADRKVLDLPEQGELTPAAIKTAFRQLARQHHPDVGGDPARFIELNQAADRLLGGVA